MDEYVIIMTGIPKKSVATPSVFKAMMDGYNNDPAMVIAIKMFPPNFRAVVTANSTGRK
ncbi:hypothetical protein D1872_303750 [compost metagenome]